MKNILLTLLIALAAHASQAEEAPAPDPGISSGWISLFNGKDLDGWTPKIRGYDFGENYADTFRVEEGVIKVSYDKYEGDFNGRYGHLFYKTPFAKYRLRVEYRFTGEQAPGGEGWATRNSGMMLHCQDPATMRKDQDFPVSIEYQLLGGLGDGKPRTTGNLCTPGTHVVMDGKLRRNHCTNSASATFEGDQWVTAEVEVNGSGVFRHYINGDLVLEYEQPQLDDRDGNARDLVKDPEKLLIESGYISLQSESHPVEFRKVEILPLD
jgi:hypothetical protein